MPKSLFCALLFHLILQNIYIWIWQGRREKTFLSCLIHGDVSFSVCSIKRILCRVRRFLFLYFLYLFLIVGTLPETCECLWAVCLRVIIEFLRVQAIEKTDLCYFVAPPSWQICFVSFSLRTIPHPSRVESQLKASHQSTRE